MMSFSIRTKIILMSLIAVGLSSLTIGIISWVLNSNSVNVAEIRQVNYPNLRMASLNEVQMQQASERFNIAVTTGDEEMLRSNRQLLTQIQENIEQIQQLSRASEQQSLSQLAAQIQEYFNRSERLAQGMIDGTIELSVAANEAQANSKLLERIQAILTESYQVQTQGFEQKVADLQKQNESTLFWLVILGVLGCALILILGAYLSYTTRRNLGLVAAKMREISSGDGDLTQRLNYQHNDEIKPLVIHFNEFVDTLQHSMSNVLGNTGNLQQLATHLVQAKDDTLTLSQRQLTGMEVVAQAVEQMAEAINEIAHNANDTADAMTKVRQRCDEGNAFVGDAIEAMRLLVTDVQQASTVVDELNRSTQDAESILDAINAIAEQTNLLALNAAIEAARAGDQGRGFAVVAAEVRTLASRTQESTKEIQKVLNQLQKQTQDVTSIIMASVTKAESCTLKSGQAEAALTQVNIHVSDVDERNTRIAAATEQQGQATQEISQNLQELNQLSQQTAVSIEVMDSVTHKLSEVQGDLSSVTTRFKV